MAKKPATIQLGDYVCSPVRSRKSATRQTEWYWTLRFRRRDKSQQKAVGWCQDRETATQKAMALIVELSAGSRPSDVGDGLLTEAIDAYYHAIDDMTELRERTRTLRRYYARHLNDWAKASWPHLKCRNFGAKHTADYKKWLVKLKLAPSTIQQILTGARVFVRWAEGRWGVADVRFPLVKVPPPKLHIPTEEHIRGAIAHADPQLAMLLEVLAYTGMRVGEALSRTWEDIDLDRGAIVIDERKGWKPKTRDSYRIVGLGQDLVDVLREFRNGADAGELVFTSHTKSAIRDYTARLNAAVMRAEITKFTFHDLRRYVSEGLRQARVGVKAYQQAMGHSVAVAMREYQHAPEAEVLDAFELARKARGAPGLRLVKDEPG